MGQFKGEDEFAVPIEVGAGLASSSFFTDRKTGLVPGIDAAADGSSGRDIGQSDKRVRNVFQRGYTEMSVLSADPPAPPAGRARLYMVMNGAKVEWRVRWPSGAVTPLATEP